ncbi:large ribosomal subunit protein bL28 [Agromyces mediolanus]|uniref:large ribosomal subunit protein bL28 n=1 Tax=Agromyces mediolanus TaxID=41986 RepID=UPI0027DF1A21|nr:L28 family ribosomal protein [Agromyces mediolanus]MCD1571316.1 hypothetical protein [Agromyces mediolanus]
MAAVCQATGAVPGFGRNISHSRRRTKRRFHSFDVGVGSFAYLAVFLLVLIPPVGSQRLLARRLKQKRGTHEEDG